MRRKLIAGNWKMNGLRASAASLIQELLDGISGAEPSVELLACELLACELLVCPPACLLETVGGLIAGTPVELGGQDCHRAEAGAHTGDISAVMLRDAGCAYVILGHSERRSDHGESDALVRAKAGAALAAGLTPIVCVGETAAERDDGRTLAVVETQLAGSLPELGPGRPQSSPTSRSGRSAADGPPARPRSARSTGGSGAGSRRGWAPRPLPPSGSSTAAR